MKSLAVNINQQRLLALMANSLNGTPIDTTLFDSLSEQDWEQLYQLVFEQTIIGIVDQLRFLGFFDRFDADPQLLFDLVKWAAVQIADAGMDVDDGADRVQKILARRRIVIGINRWQF